MAEHHGKGRVKFREPAVKMVAEMPRDADMREHLRDKGRNDEFAGSCGMETAAQSKKADRDGAD